MKLYFYILDRNRKFNPETRTFEKLLLQSELKNAM